MNLQCASCNLSEGGNFIAYERRLRLKFGDEVVDEIREKAEDRNPLCDERSFYTDKIEYYRALNREAA